MYVLINLGNRENHLVSVSSNGTTTTFVYDGSGNRVKKTVTGGDDILYLNKYYEKNLTTGNITTSYYLGGRLVATCENSTLRYVHEDHLTSTSLMTDDEGNEISSIDYYPYGDYRNSQPEIGNFPTDRLFTGQRYDDTGLYYYGARYYDPTIGRFISADTIVQYTANPQSFNRYSYCLNNPLKYVDPSGHYVYIEGYDVRAIDWYWQNPTLAMLVPGAVTNISAAATSPVYESYDNYRTSTTAEDAFAAFQMETSADHNVYFESVDAPIYETGPVKTTPSGNDYTVVINKDVFNDLSSFRDSNLINIIRGEVHNSILDMQADFDMWEVIYSTISFGAAGYVLDAGRIIDTAVQGGNVGLTVSDIAVSCALAVKCPPLGWIKSILSDLNYQQKRYLKKRMELGGFPWRKNDS